MSGKIQKKQGLVVFDFKGTLEQILNLEAEAPYKKEFIAQLQRLKKRGFSIVVCSSDPQAIVEAAILQGLGTDGLACFTALKPKDANDKTSKRNQLTMYFNQFDPENKSLNSENFIYFDDDETMKFFMQFTIAKQLGCSLQSLPEAWGGVFSFGKQSKRYFAQSF